MINDNTPSRRYKNNDRKNTFNDGAYHDHYIVVVNDL